ncbi:MAG: hypothetical protein QW076_02590 [Candidatus Anstonellales archaeon]
MVRNHNKKILVLLLVVVVHINSIFSQDTTFYNKLYWTIIKPTSDMCMALRTMLPVISMLMIIGAAVVYILGQFTGAETRNRANVYATYMLTGAIIGLLIAVVAPEALSLLLKISIGTPPQTNPDGSWYTCGKRIL